MQCTFDYIIMKVSNVLCSLAEGVFIFNFFFELSFSSGLEIFNLHKDPSKYNDHFAHSFPLVSHILPCSKELWDEMSEVFLKWSASFPVRCLCKLAKTIW